ncbi:MAG: DUF4159 domain-containing protein [Planctomycetes bacterium]|nr:DUF4159 domain-containing protein [Planctomycetota bacterium]
MPRQNGFHPVSAWPRGRRWGASPLRLAAVACAAAGLLAAGRPATAECPCDEGRPRIDALDLVLVIDTTASMSDVLASVRDRAGRIVAVLESCARRLRVGVVAFRTEDDPMYKDGVIGVQLTENHSEARRFIESLVAAGGGKEAIDLALATAFEKMNWSTDARKVVLLIGDESEHSNSDQKLLDLCDRAKARGITLSTFTARFVRDLSPYLPPEGAARVRGLREQIDLLWKTRPARDADYPEVSRRILQLTRAWDAAVEEEWRHLPPEQRRLPERDVLPLFRDLAARSGGEAVGVGHEGDLARWVLSVAVGRQTDPDDPRWRGAAAERYYDAASWARRDATARAATTLAQIVTDGDWRAPHGLEGVIAALSRRVEHGLSPVKYPLRLDRDDLSLFPILYLSGHGAFTLGPENTARLRDHLARGAALIAEPCCGSPAFIASFERLAADLGVTLAPAEPDHPAVSGLYPLARVTLQAVSRGGTAERVPPRVLIGSLGGEECVAFVPFDIGCGWRRDPTLVTCQCREDDAVKLGANLLAWALRR